MPFEVETVGGLHREGVGQPSASVRGALKIGVIGAGAVGSACMLSTVMRGFAREIVLVNRNRKRAKGVVTDMQYGASLSGAVDLYDGGAADLAGAAPGVVIAGGECEAGDRSG